MRGIAAVLSGTLFVGGAAGYGQELTRVYPLGSGTDTRTVQEIATVLRTVLDVKSLNVDMNGFSLNVQGSQALLSSTDWLMPLVSSQPAEGSKPLIYDLPDNGDVVEVYHLSNINTMRGIQEVLTNLRIVMRVQKIFNVTEPRLIVFRGPSDQVAESDWLLRKLDVPAGPPPPGIHDYSAPAGDVLRVFYLPPSVSPDTMQEILKSIRTKAQIMFTFNMTSPPAVSVRATPEQIAQVEPIIAASGR